MPHDHLKGSIQTQTGRASILLIATLMGGVLVLSSFLADFAFADAIIVTGSVTGDAPTVEQIQQAIKGVTESVLQVPVLIGSGLNAENVNPLLSMVGGAIVGTSLMKDRAVNPDAASKFMSQVRRLRQG